MDLDRWGIPPTDSEIGDQASGAMQVLKAGRPLSFGPIDAFERQSVS